MNDKFFPELARRLKQEGIATAPVDKACILVLVDGQEAMWVEPRGSIVLKAGAQDDPQVKEVYENAIRASALVYEYTEAMSAAPLLKADGLHEDFRLLAEFNGIVLAGQELERDWGYKFVTWRRDGDGTGVAHGNYYHNGYGAAKQDFACRSGLVQESRQFTDEQLTELYRCIYETLDSGYPITREREKTLRAAMEQIAASVDDLEERVSLSNQRELEAAEQQADSGSGMEMVP